MASKIEKELVKATGIEQEDGEKRSKYLTRLGRAVGKLADVAWDKLSAEAQDWYNANAKARNAAKEKDEDLPDFTEFGDAEEEKPTRSRARDDDGDEKPAKKGKGEQEESAMKKGSRVKITTKKDKVYQGEVVELGDEFVVVKTADGKEVEIDLEKIAHKEIFHGNAGAEEADEDVDVLKKGTEVKLVTKRGKEVVGTIVSIDEDEVVLKTDDGEEDFQRTRVESITPVGGKKATKAAAKEEAEEKPAKKTKTDDDSGEEKKGRSKNADGVSVSDTIAEIICDDLEASEEDVAKALKKKGVEAKENTVHLNYVQVHRVIKVLKAKKLLKA